MSGIATFYNKVIDDVIEGVREAFIQDGVDLDVLEQLKKLWISKFAETRVTDPEPAAQPASHYARVLGTNSNPVNQVPIARLPLQLPVPGSLRSLAPIARPNAPLPTVPVGSSTNQQSGLVMSPGQQQRPAIVLASALNTQSSNPQAAFANVTFRPQPNAPGQTAIIGQPTLAGVNGMAAFHGQNIQFVQLGQPLMMPIQLRPQTVIQTQPQQQQQQQQQQSFPRSQVDGTGDFSDDEETEVLEPYSVETPLLRSGPTSLVPVHPTPQRQFQLETSAQQTPAGGTGGDGDSDDDDDGMVAATPHHTSTTSFGHTPKVTVGKRPPDDTTTVSVVGDGGAEKRARILSPQGSGFGHGDSDADVDSDPDDFDPDQVGLELTSVSSKMSRRKQKRPIRGGGGGGHEDERISVKLEEDESKSPPLPPEEPEDVTEGGDEEEEEEEEEPLNSDDDVSDEDADLIFRSGDLVVCQYERFTRARSRWRFWLRDGIMKINGREQVFQRLLVEADWMYDSQHNRAAM